MAFIMGLCSPDEIKKIEALGYEVEYLTLDDLRVMEMGSGRDGDVPVKIFVDTDVICIIDGPDWDGPRRKRVEAIMNNMMSQVDSLRDQFKGLHKQVFPKKEEYGR